MVFPYCHRCKGNKDLCGLGRCPLLERVRERMVPFETEGGTIEGPSPPSVFVGSHDYPRLSIGPLTTPVALHRPERLESSDFLFERTLSEVYSIRSSLIRGKYRMNVKAASEPGVLGSRPLFELDRTLPLRGRKVLGSIQELALSARSLDTELVLSDLMNKVSAPPSIDTITMPMGPSVNISNLMVHDQPKVPNMVEKAASDTDLEAAEASLLLYRSGIPLQHLVRLFSVGLLGEGKRRRIVPTRWTITALDDMLSKAAKRRVSGLPPLERYLLYSGERFGNHFLIALFPPPFRFEMLEQWQKGSLWGEGDIAFDYEGPRGRKGYADSITGAYYAARLSVLEHLERIGRNAGASVIRWITDEYWAPLGVWVIRETVKRALEGPPLVHEDLQGLMDSIDNSSGIRGWRTRTKFLGGIVEKTLDDYL